ncbi:hypothetical protein [Nonomuraea turcica]|uniref:hypothetical protein n=1 Tax=Nonomuraea sp. G32 TaxID=3067274 RepID=UPI00273A8469|nr:hypothetical protein [Nonomuraea sp. G32]MDP4506972.1 hypothetical protein [Nonomuraea sp. G32]
MNVSSACPRSVSRNVTWPGDARCARHRGDRVVLLTSAALIAISAAHKLKIT